MEQEIKKLREATGWNIIVLFWLGIIDLETYVFQLLEPKFESIKNPLSVEENKERDDGGIIDDN